MFERKTWQQLACFESHDYVGTWYKARHNRTANAEHTKEITSCFSQGREYFASAADAAISVKPLLLYYGALALVRGVILLSNSYKREASLKPNHGLEVVDWQQTLAGGIANVLDLKVRATSGTFGELVESVANLQPTAWFSHAHNQWGFYHAAYPKPAFATDGTTFTLDDLVSRDHRLLDLYERTTGRASRVLLGELVAENNHVDVSIFHTESLTKAQVEALAPTGTTVKDRNGARRMPHVPNYYYRVSAADLEAVKALLPATQYIKGEVVFVLEAFPNGDRLNEFLRTFLLAYCMGMLVRYFPSKWIALQRNEKGDVAQPVLMTVVDAVESDFPTLVLTALS